MHPGIQYSVLTLAGFHEMLKFCSHLQQDFLPIWVWHLPYKALKPPAKHEGVVWNEDPKRKTIWISINNLNRWITHIYCNSNTKRKVFCATYMSVTVELAIIKFHKLLSTFTCHWNVHLLRLNLISKLLMTFYIVFRICCISITGLENACVRRHKLNG